MNKKSVRFGLLGCGKISERHAQEMVKLGMLTAVCDINPERADKLAERYQTKAYYSYAEMLEKEKNNLDLISVCTPNGLHKEHSIQALLNGQNVLCEKPLAIHTADAKEMLDTATRVDKKLFVVKSTRFNKVILALKKAIDSHLLGELYSFQMNCFWNRTDEYYLKDEWRGTIALDGGCLYTQFSHYIDILSWLFGAAQTISGERKNFIHQKSVEFEDTGVASLVLQNGMLGGVNWSINAVDKNIEISLAIFAEKGTVKLGGAYLNTIEYESPSGILKLDNKIVDNGANDYGFYQGSMSNHDKVYAHLINSLESGEKLIADGMDGLNTVKFIESIYQNCSLIK